MNNSISDFKQEFKRIKRMGWIEIVPKEKLSVGAKFERLIGKMGDQLPYPDYEDIEIKVKSYASISKICLFTSTPIGNFANPMENLLESYGYPNQIIHEAKSLSGDVAANKKHYIGLNYLYQLIVDEQEQKIKMLIYNKNNNVINDSYYWNFKDLEDILHTKMAKLAVVKVLKRHEGEKDYLKYYRADIYKLRSFNCFIKLIKEGKIIIKLNIGTFTSGRRIGQIHDHGTAFAIDEKYLVELFDKIDWAY